MKIIADLVLWMGRFALVMMLVIIAALEQVIGHLMITMCAELSHNYLKMDGLAKVLKQVIVSFANQEGHIRSKVKNGADLALKTMSNAWEIVVILAARKQVIGYILNIMHAVLVQKEEHYALLVQLVIGVVKLQLIGMGNWEQDVELSHVGRMALFVELVQHVGIAAIQHGMQVEHNAAAING